MHLSDVHPLIRRRARRAIHEYDAQELVRSAYNLDPLVLVRLYRSPLQRYGIYEEALVCAFTGSRETHHEWSVDDPDKLFRMGDRKRLQGEGIPLPQVEMLRLYRGVSGWEPYRKTRGLSWTTSLDAACWFAMRNGYPDHAVYVANVPTE